MEAESALVGAFPLTVHVIQEIGQVERQPERHAFEQEAADLVGKPGHNVDHRKGAVRVAFDIVTLCHHRANIYGK